jgi:hypothetical protein
MREITNTAGSFELIPEGTRNFMVCGEIKKLFVGPNKDKEMFVVPLQFDAGIGEQTFLKNMMGPLLRQLGAKEISPNRFDWDTLEFEGKSFSATVAHKADKNNPDKKRSHMGEIKEAVEIPF